MTKQTLLFLFFASTFLCSQNIIYGQQKNSEIKIHESIQLETDKIFDKLVQVRRRFHENPELAGKEKMTQEFIKNYLLDLGIHIETNIYGHAVVVLS